MISRFIKIYWKVGKEVKKYAFSSSRETLQPSLTIKNVPIIAQTHYIFILIW